ncbi:MarR family winged helix-turn-helix transcriptional regulator [Nostocoides sp.]|jgi:DNA-binding MarR family transcriptional regulator|uniref:MarR family winged helix-turn-helix transcriptional regulator n=1 Tax=Nostocoides sp. TaxID=1917966 RepID=UPI003BAFC1B8
MSRVCSVNPTTLPSRTDDVDAIVTAWHRERPDLDLAPLHVLSRVTRLARRLDQARREAFAGLGLEIWEFDVLSALRRTGAPYRLSPGQLLDATLVTSGTMTNRVDRLSERGLVRRLPSPRDRRGVLVELTPAGAQCVDGALAALLEQERAILAVLSPHDQEQLADALRTLHTALG